MSHHYRIHEQDEHGDWHVYRYTDESADAALLMIFGRRESGAYSNDLARRLADRWERHYDEALKRQHQQARRAAARIWSLALLLAAVCVRVG